MNQELISLVANYKNNPDQLNFIQDKKIVTISGLTTSGKDVLIKELLKTNRYLKVKTATTREPRPNEDLKSDYLFMTFNDAKKLLKECKFFEVAIVHQNVYGTLFEEIKKVFLKNKEPIFNINIQGANFYRKIVPNIISFFILPPSFEIIQKRFIDRGGKEEDFIIRLKSSLKELKQILKSNEYYVIVNDNLAQTVKEIEAISQNQDNLKNDQIDLIHSLIKDIKLYLDA